MDGYGDCVMGTASIGINERDVDLLLVEELQCSSHMLQWFCAQINGDISAILPESVTNVNVRHSCLFFGEGHGESDIVVEIAVIRDGVHERLVFLIENKISAGFQVEQAQRYSERLSALITKGGFNDGRTVLVAPQHFLDSEPQCRYFQARIPYERLIEYFSRRARSCAEPETACRLTHRQEFLERALWKKKGDWTVKNPDPRVATFRQRYFERVSEIAPRLRLAAPGPKKDPNAWFRYHSALGEMERPRRFLLMHKPYGRAAIEVKVARESQSRVLGQIRQLLESSMNVEHADASFTIYLRTPRLYGYRGIEEQIENVDRCVHALLRLQTWFHSHRERLAEIIAA